MFSLDMMLAFLMLLATAFAALWLCSFVAAEAAGSYEDLVLQKKLFDASEMLVATAGLRDSSGIRFLGLAKVEGKTVRHHALDAAKIEALRAVGKESIARLLGLEGYDVGIKLDGEVLFEANSPRRSVRRFALCPNERPCVLEISGVRADD